MNFLEQIKNNPDVTGVTVIKSEDVFWDYYTQCCGFLKDKYFAVVFKSLKGKKQTVISSETEDVAFFKEYFSIFE